MSKIDREKLMRLYQKGETSKGKQILTMLKHLDASFFVLSKNYEELYNANDLYMRDWSLVKPVNRVKLDLFKLEFSRLLHNYLASFASFVEHTRVFCAHLDNPQLNKDYVSEKKKQKIKEKTRLAKDLQNYSRHYQLPIVDARLLYLMRPERITNGTVLMKPEGIFKHELSLNKEDLLKWNGWSHTSKESLKQFGDELSIFGLTGRRGFASECQSSTEKLYDWLSCVVKELYSTEIKEFLKIQSEIKRLSETRRL